MEAAKSKPAQSRFYLRNLKSKLDDLDIDQLKYLHLLFEMNYMEDCHFWFRDEWFVDGYYECYNDWYRNDCKTTPYDLNQMVLISWKSGRNEAIRNIDQRWKASRNGVVANGISLSQTSS